MDIVKELLKIARVLEGRSFDVGYIFVVYDEKNKEFAIGQGGGSDPKRDMEILREHMKENDAKRLVKQLSRRWKEAEIVQFLVVGEGHRAKYKEKKVLHGV